MHIDWWTLGLQAINALVLIWLLSRFLFRPIADIVAARRQAAGELLAQARDAKAAAERERDAAAERTRELDERRAQALQEIDTQAAEQSEALLAQARRDAQALQLAAKEQIVRARQADAAVASERAIRLAADIAAKLLERLPDDARVSGFIDALAAELPKLPDATRATLGADGSPIRLVAARTPSAQQMERCRAAFEAALGHRVTLDWAVNPELIAGLELDAPHASVRNSLRNDLQHVESELLKHDRDTMDHG